MLALVGLGMKAEDLTLEALEILKRADEVWLDTYTNVYESAGRLAELLGRKDLRLAKRADLEGPGAERIIERAREALVAIAVPGDPLIATTHNALVVEALKRGVGVKVVGGLSIASLAFTKTGLHFYKLGKTITLTFPDAEGARPVVEALRENFERGLHTLVLLDLRLDEGRAMTIPEAVDLLLEGGGGLLEGRVAVGLARLGFRDEAVAADLLPRLGRRAWPPPPHALLFPGSLHPVELESLRYACGLPEELYVKLAGRRSAALRG